MPAPYTIFFSSFAFISAIRGYLSSLGASASPRFNYLLPGVLNSHDTNIIKLFFIAHELFQFMDNRVGNTLDSGGGAFYNRLL